MFPLLVVLIKPLNPKIALQPYSATSFSPWISVCPLWPLNFLGLAGNKGICYKGLSYRGTVLFWRLFSGIYCIRDI